MPATCLPLTAAEIERYHRDGFLVVPELVSPAEIGAFLNHSAESKTNTAGEMLGTQQKPGKRELYFQAGCKEFWMCDEAGQILFYAASGQLPQSQLCPGFPDKV